MESDEYETTLWVEIMEDGRNAPNKGVSTSENYEEEEVEAEHSLFSSFANNNADDWEESFKVGEISGNWCESNEHCYLHRAMGNSSLDRKHSPNSRETNNKTRTTWDKKRAAAADEELIGYEGESLEMQKKNNSYCTRRRLDVYWFSWTFVVFLLLLSEQGTFQQRNNNGSTRQRWSKYQTALSNTGPLGEVATGGESDTQSGMPLVSSDAVTGMPSSMIMSTPTSEMNYNSSKASSNNNNINISSQAPSFVGGGRNLSETGNGLVAVTLSTVSTTTSLASTRHQHQQQTRSVTSSRGVNNSGSISTYNNNRNNNNNNGKMSSSSGSNAGVNTPSSSAARKRIYEDLGHKFTDGALFENNTSINITVPLGDTAFLRCRVRNLGERSISWIRRRDWHILTTGKTTYTNDERFHVLHTEGTDDWTLQIKFVQQRDNGTYECQISTGTGIISFMVNLLIAVPEAFILGNGDEYHVEQGSTINLVCVIEKSPKVPEFIFWYHNDRMINYGSSREVTVRTEPGARTQSRLTIRDARISDSGNYTCKTAHAEPASIFVYVSQASGLFSGDKIAAIQRRKSSASSGSSGSVSSTSSASSSSTGYYYHHPDVGHLFFTRKIDKETCSSSCLFVEWLTTKMTRMSFQSFPLFLVISQFFISSAILSSTSSTLPSTSLGSLGSIKA